jgi:hypothetical protein
MVPFIDSCFVRIQLGSVFIHLAVQGSAPTVRKAALSTLERLTTLYPEALNRVARDALVAYISKEQPAKPKVAPTEETSSEDKTAVNRQARLSAFLYTCAAFGADTPVPVKQRLLADLLIIAHHTGVCKCSGRYWV